MNEIQSEFIPKMFEDGSGDGMYLTNSNCTWILRNATHIKVDKYIRGQDRLNLFRKLLSFLNG